MDKNRILENNKKAAPADEGVQHLDNRARGVGTTCMLAVIAALIVYNLFKGLPSEGLQTVLWAYVGTEALYKYRHSKGKTWLVAAVAGLAASVLFLANYILQSW